MYPPHHLAGAEMMLHSILRMLVKRGHECRVVISQGIRIPLGIPPYALDGVKVSEDEDALQGCDVVFTHLDRTPDAEELTMRWGIPLAHIVHNHLTLSRCNVGKADLIVYNTRWLSEAVSFPAPSLVVHPPIHAADYRCKPGQCLTLVNLQEAKGAYLFYELARMMPDRQFLGVIGAYGEQIVRDLPNVTIAEPTNDMREVYSQTRVLLMPSEYESYGRCAVEAAVSGIPTVAHPTAGLVEALGSSGTYPPILDAGYWKTAIEQMDWDDKSGAARRQAQTLDPKAEIDALEGALRQTCGR